MHTLQVARRAQTPSLAALAHVATSEVHEEEAAAKALARCAVAEVEGWGQLHLSSRSTTGYKGVWRQASGRFTAQLSRNDCHECLGTYNTALEVAVAYARAAAEAKGGLRPLPPRPRPRSHRAKVSGDGSLVADAPPTITKLLELRGSGGPRLERERK